jgi:hypothetical protein
MIVTPLLAKTLIGLKVCISRRRMPPYKVAFRPFTSNLDHVIQMPEREITERQLHAFRRFLERLPHGKEIDLVILKAHLLVEEQVNALLQERLKDPSILLDEERFESFYRIRLAQAFFPADFQPWLWHALKQLNKLRNRIAHHFEPKGIDNLVDDLIRSIPGDIGKDAPTRQERFEFALWSLFDAVSELVEARKAPVVELVNRDEA